MIPIYEDVLQRLQQMAVKFSKTQRMYGLRPDWELKGVNIDLSLFTNRYQCYSITQKRLYNKRSGQTRSYILCRLGSLFTILWLNLAFPEKLPMNISSLNYRGNPIKNLSQKLLWTKKNKSSYNYSEAMQQNPRISRHLLSNKFLHHHMEWEKITGFICLGMMILVKILSH